MQLHELGQELTMVFSRKRTLEHRPASALPIVASKADRPASTDGGAPLLIRSTDIPEFFQGTRVHALATLQDEGTFDAILSTACEAVDAQGIETAITLLGFYITSAHRDYSRLVSG